MGGFMERPWQRWEAAMPVSRCRLVLTVLVLPWMACASFPLFGKVDESAQGGADSSKLKEPPVRALLELQNVRYDGEALSGRILIGVAEGRLTIDKRLVENASVEVELVWDCVTGEAVGFMEVDSFPKPASKEELLTLTPGYWYGADVSFFLFDPQFTGTPAPGCIDVSIVYRMEGGHIAGRSRVRAERQQSPVPPGPGGKLD